jgi:hypothetical protein
MARAEAILTSVSSIIERLQIFLLWKLIEMIDIDEDGRGSITKFVIVYNDSHHVNVLVASPSRFKRSLRFYIGMPQRAMRN